MAVIATLAADAFLNPSNQRAVSLRIGAVAERLLHFRRGLQPEHELQAENRRAALLHSGRHARAERARPVHEVPPGERAEQTLRIEAAFEPGEDAASAGKERAH